MITNLVNKYGLVPKCVYQESHHGSSNSRELNAVLKKKFEEYAHNLRESDSPHELKDVYVSEVYKLLCYFLRKAAC